MKNPFIQHEKATNARKRNAFDLSFQNNLSLPIGAEVPVLVKEAVPGDSFRIKAGAFLRAWPTVFPVQTPIRMTLHLFKVYNRTLQDNFMDMVYNNDSTIEHPYLQQPSSFYKVGSIADYMGVPVSYYSDVVRTVSFGGDYGYIYVFNPDDGLSFSRDDVYAFSTDSLQLTPDTRFVVTAKSDGYLSLARIRSLREMKYTLRRIPTTPPSVIKSRFILYCGVQPNNISPRLWFPIYTAENAVLTSNTDQETIAVDINKMVDAVNNYQIPPDINDTPLFVPCFWLEGYGNDSGRPVGVTLPIDFYRFDYVYDESNGISIAEGASNPFARDIRLNALPFRAYEAIHNSFYRDPLNDPWYLDGKPQYNRYVTNKGDGADSTSYHLFYRNWEKDFLTSAYPSPQQGIAPLVGITARGRMTFEMSDGTTRDVQATFADDNETISGFVMSKEVAEDPVLRASVMDVVSQGISINNLRDVGSYQRWLEANQRGRMRYRDQVYSHTGVKIDFDELDMPEFIGGYSRVVNTAQINNMSAQGDAPLGAFGGQLSFFNGMEHSVTTFFKEHGWLIGILTITPVPCYGQLLPKHFLKDNPLSYFNPEFAQVGMQPITYKEVCPLQVADGSTSTTLNDVFGYQRPWYDLIASVDEVHGQMRTTMRDFIMNRTFSGVPYLNAEFLHIDPEQVNKVFTYTDGSQDTFFGQIVFDITKKTQIPRAGIPMLNA